MPLLEVCVDSLEGLRAAERGGAGRIELCSRLDVGGLSPGRELLEAAIATTKLPLHVMVRPRTGGFVWSMAEVDAMEEEIRALRGVPGVVIGALTPYRTIDVGTTKKLVRAARPASVTFHRAFDAVDDQAVALEELVRLRVDRVLTSGGAPDAYQGRSRLRELVHLARGRIVVMPGGGVRAENAAAILAETGAAELHGSVPFFPSRASDPGSP